MALFRPTHIAGLLLVTAVIGTVSYWVNAATSLVLLIPLWFLVTGAEQTRFEHASKNLPWAATVRVMALYLVVVQAVLLVSQMMLTPIEVTFLAGATLTGRLALQLACLRTESVFLALLYAGAGVPLLPLYAATQINGAMVAACEVGLHGLAVMALLVCVFKRDLI